MAAPSGARPSVALADVYELVCLRRQARLADQEIDAARSRIDAQDDELAEQRDAFAGMVEPLTTLRAELEAIEYLVPASSAIARIVRDARLKLADLATVATIRGGR